MVQRKLIAVLGVVALLAGMAGVSEASLSRVEGLGLSSVPYLSQFTDDYVNIFPYPTSVVRQNNLVLMEVGHNPDGEVNSVDSESDQSFTMIKNFNFGAIAFQMEQSDLNSSFPSNLNNQNLDLIWGKGFSNMDLAVRLDFTNSSYEFNDSADNSVDYKGLSFIGSTPYPFLGIFPDAIVGTGVELNSWGITPAVAFHLANDNRVEAALTLRNYNLERSSVTGGVADETWEDDGNRSYSVLVRGIMNQGDRATWFPAVWYVNDDLSYTVSNIAGGTVEDRQVDEKYRNYGVGISHNMRVNDNNLLIFGLAVGETKHTYERGDANDGVLNAETNDLTEKATVLPIFFGGLETDATSWLKLRFGATNALTKLSDEESTFAGDSFEEKFKFSDFDFSLGAGLRWNNLDIDFTMNEAFPLSGGFILSGDEATPVTRASATYHY